MRWRRASHYAWALAAAAALTDAMHAATGWRLGLSVVYWTTWLPVTTLGLCAAAALLAAAATERASRSPSLMLGAGIACYAPGTAVYTQIVAHSSSHDFPNPADFLWMVFYPLALAALIVIFRRSQSAHRGVVLADAAIGALTALAAGSVLLLHFVLRGGVVDGDSTGSIVYSFGDQLLVGAAIGTFALYRWRPPRALVILTVGLLLQAVEDAVYAHSLVRDVFPADGWLIAFWLTNFAIISAAVVFRGAVATEERQRKPGAGMLGTVATGFIVVVVTIAIMVDPRPWMVAIALDSAALLVVVARMGLALRSNARLLREARDDSRTDPLTTLANRRALHETVERELKQAERAGTSLTIAIYDLDGFKAYNDSYGHPSGDALLRRLATRLTSALPIEAQAFRLGGDEFCVLIPEGAGEADVIVARCLDALTESGETFYITSSYGTAMLPREGTTLKEGLTRADQRLYAMKANRPRRRQQHGVTVLREILATSDPEVQRHQNAVARLAVATGRHLGLSSAQLGVLAQAAEFHDVGKIAIPDSILSKPGPLDEDEWAYMHRHTLIGERFMLAVPGMEKVAKIIRSSHERVDGRGYPDGLSGSEILLEARIIAVCDAFHAMTHARPYSPSRTNCAALEELYRGAGTQFDARAVRALAAVVHAEDEPDRLHPHPASAVLQTA